MEPSPASKFGLVAVNGIIMVYSLAIVVLNSVRLVSFYDFSRVLYDSLIVIPAINIGVGTAAFLLAIFGALVSTRKSYCLGITYCVLISVVLLIELTLGISYYVLFFLNIYTNTEDGLFTSIQQYQLNREFAADWDWMQRQYSCCGVRSARDWDVVVNTTLWGLPMTCCRPIIGEVGNSTCLYTSVNRNLAGCYSPVSSVFADNGVVTAGMLLALVLLEIICIIIGSVFTHPLKNAW